MIIGIDIDDTLSSLYNYKLKKAVEYIEKNKLKFKLIDDSAYLLGDIFDWDEKARNDFWWSEFNEALLKTPAQKDAGKITHQLKKDGHTIIVITARNDEEHHDPYKESLEWLNKNNIYFDKLIVRGGDKGRLCKEHKIDIFLDDYIHNVLRIQELGTECVIFTARHNESFENKSVKRVNNWQEFYDYINEVKQRN